MTTLKNDLFGELGPSAVTCSAALEVNGLLLVLELDETQHWASVRPTEDLVDVMREGQASHFLANGTTCYIFTAQKVLVICSGGLTLLEVIASLVSGTGRVL